MNPEKQVTLALTPKAEKKEGEVIAVDVLNEAELEDIKENKEVVEEITEV